MADLSSFSPQTSPVLLICTPMSSKTLCKTAKIMEAQNCSGRLHFISFHSSLVVFGPLCPSSEIEPSADDIHAELVEDEDEEVTLRALVVMVVLVKREETKCNQIHVLLSCSLLLAKVPPGSHILSISCGQNCHATKPKSKAIKLAARLADCQSLVSNEQCKQPQEAGLQG